MSRSCVLFWNLEKTGLDAFSCCDWPAVVVLEQSNISLTMMMMMLILMDKYLKYFLDLRITLLFYASALQLVQHHSLSLWFFVCFSSLLYYPRPSHFVTLSIALNTLCIGGQYQFTIIYDLYYLSPWSLFLTDSLLLVIVILFSTPNHKHFPPMHPSINTHRIPIPTVTLCVADTDSEIYCEFVGWDDVTLPGTAVVGRTYFYKNRPHGGGGCCCCWMVDLSFRSWGLKTFSGTASRSDAASRVRGTIKALVDPPNFVSSRWLPIAGTRITISIDPRIFFVVVLFSQWQFVRATLFHVSCEDRRNLKCEKEWIGRSQWKLQH